MPTVFMSLFRPILYIFFNWILIIVDARIESIHASCLKLKSPKFDSYRVLNQFQFGFAFNFCNIGD